jgi:hypothetical protein
MEMGAPAPAATGQSQFGMLDWLKKNPKIAAAMGIGGAGLGGAVAGNMLLGGDSEPQEEYPQEYYM